MTGYRLVVGLCQDPVGELKALPRRRSWISGVGLWEAGGEEERRKRKIRRGKKEKGKEGGSGKGPQG